MHYFVTLLACKTITGCHCSVTCFHDAVAGDDRSFWKVHKVLLCASRRFKFCFPGDRVSFIRPHDMFSLNRKTNLIWSTKKMRHPVLWYSQDALPVL